MNMGNIGGFGRISVKDLAGASSVSVTHGQDQSKHRAKVEHSEDEHRGHGRHRNGGLGPAMTQALDALGVSLPSKFGGAEGGERGESNPGSVESRTLRHDLRKFMHELFDALRNEKPGGTTMVAADGITDSSTNGSTMATTTPVASETALTTGVSTTQANSTASAGSPGGISPTSQASVPRADFGSRLTALISDISKGAAPKELQDAFDRLAKDLTPASAPSGTTTTSGGGTTPAVTTTGTTTTGSNVAGDAVTTGASSAISISSNGASSNISSTVTSASTGATAGAGEVSATTSSTTFTLKNLLLQLQKALGYGPAGSMGASYTPAVGGLLSISA